MRVCMRVCVVGIVLISFMNAINASGNVNFTAGGRFFDDEELWEPTEIPETITDTAAVAQDGGHVLQTLLEARFAATKYTARRQGLVVHAPISTTTGDRHTDPRAAPSSRWA